MVKKLIPIFALATSVSLAELFIEVPPNPNSNLNSFRQQLINYHLHKAYEKLKENDPFFRNLEFNVQSSFKDIFTSKEETIPLSNSTAVVSGYSKLQEPILVSIKGANLLKGIFFYELRYTNVCMRNTFDAIHENYRSEFNYSNMSVYYSSPISTNSFNTGITYSRTFK